MEMKIPAIAITAFVVIVVLAGVLIPVLNDATALEDTYVNRGFFYVDLVDDEQSLNYHFEDGTLTINGVPAPLPSDSTYPDGLTLFFTEHITARFDGSLIRIKGQVNYGCSMIDLTATNGTITGTYVHSGTSSTANWSYTKFVGMVTGESDRIMSKPVPQYVHADSVIETTGFTRCPNINDYYVIDVHGTIEDGATATLYYQGNGSLITTASVSDVKINYTTISNHEDLYKVDSITFKVTKDTVSDDVTYTIYTVPAEVTAARTDHFSDNEIAIFAAIPIMVIVALLIAVVALVFRSKF